MLPRSMRLSDLSPKPPAPPSKDTLLDPEPPTPPPKDVLPDDPADSCGQWIENDGTAAPIVGLDPGEGKVLGYHDEKITIYSDEKNINCGDIGKQTVIVETYLPEQEIPMSLENRQLSRFSRRRVFVIRAVAAALVLAIIIAGAVGGTMAARNRKIPPILPIKSSQPVTPTIRPRYPNTGLAATEWIDLNGTLHKRLYYQDKNNMIRESSWDNSTAFDAAWSISIISDAVKPGTPVAAAAGYPHASYNYSLVKNVYYMATDDKLMERQAPSNDSQAWEDDNFSGLYSGSNNSFLAAYWHQNIKNASEELVVLFQQQNFANGITQGRYTSNKTTSNPWVAQNFGFSQPQGSNFALAPASFRSATLVMLYTIDDSSTLQQYEYVISDTDLVPGAVVSLIASTGTDIKVDQQSPLAVVAQDNQPPFTVDKLPECAKATPLTNLIFFPAADASSLILRAWNCSTGFLDQTSEIEALQKPNTTYLSLAAVNDKVSGYGTLYIMYDSGSGPLVEEWTVPLRAGEPWVTRRNVSIDLELK